MKFKNPLLFLLSFLLVISSLGMAVNVHFCKGSIATISHEFSQTKACEMSEKVTKKTCCKKKSSTKKCCSDKKVSFKSKTDKISYKNAFTFDLFLESTTFPQVIDTPICIVQNKKQDFYSFETHAPPLYKLYCRFTLYA